MTVSRSHALRQADLETFAQHLGFHIPFVLPDDRMPDVLLAHVQARRVFVGDAKHTESPSDPATRARLLAYLNWSASVEARSDGYFAIAHTPGFSAEWIEAIKELTAEAGIVAGLPWTKRLNVTTEVVVFPVRSRRHA